MTKKYYGIFSGNGGSTYNRKAWDFTSKATAERHMQEVVRAGHIRRTGNRSYYRITDEDGRTVSAGSLIGFNKNFIHKNYED